MRVEKKTMSRAGWKRILKSRYTFAPFNEGALCGMAGLIRMDEVTEPLYTFVLNQNLKIVDSGFWWLQIAPHGKNWVAHRHAGCSGEDHTVLF